MVLNNSRIVLFFELLQVALGNRDRLSRVPSAKEWIALYKESEKQSIVGVMLDGLERLPEEQLPPKDLLLQWIGIGQLIEKQNQLVNRRCSELVKKISADGYKSCLLKGQGNSLMYPHANRRTAGDIDIWIEGGKKKIVEYVHGLFSDISVQYHHTDFPIFDDVEVEAHYYPSFCYNKIHNKRLQRYFTEKGFLQFDNYAVIGGENISIPTVSFNIVFQLSHMMRHFFTQGIGIRHAVDFYYLLSQKMGEEDIQEAIDVIKYCGMYKFMCAMMYIEQDIFGLQYNLSIAPVNERAGKMVLNEIMKGGNFGKSFVHNSGNALWMFTKQMAYRLSYIVEFPSEPLWRPIAHLWDHLENKLVWKKYN